MTTGHVVTAVLDDLESQASRALAAVGVSQESLVAALARVGLAGTTDAGPVPLVEVKVGDVTTTIEDPDVAAVLADLTADEIRAGLMRAFGTYPHEKATGSEG